MHVVGRLPDIREKEGKLLYMWGGRERGETATQSSHHISSRER